MESQAGEVAGEGGKDQLSEALSPSPRGSDVIQWKFSESLAKGAKWLGFEFQEVIPQDLIFLTSKSEPAQEDTGVEHDPHDSSLIVLKFHITIIPLLQMRLREGTCLAQGHTVYKAWWREGLWVSRVVLFGVLVYCLGFGTLFSNLDGEYFWQTVVVYIDE